MDVQTVLAAGSRLSNVRRGFHYCLLAWSQGAYILASTCAKGAPCAANTGGLHGFTTAFTSSFGLGTP